MKPNKHKEKDSMSCKKNTTQGRKFKQLSKSDRDTIERMKLKGAKNADIARVIKVDPSTISREIKKGSFLRRRRNPTISKDPAVPEYIDEWVYEAYEAQRRHDDKKKNCGAKNTILNNVKLLKYVEEKVLGPDKWSLDAARGYAEANNLFPGQGVCLATLYNWVDAGLSKIKNGDLLLKLKRKKRSKRQDKKRSLGKSIDKRPKEVEDREEFGHWEGDGIVGTNRQGHLISLVERKTGIGLLFNVGDSESKHMVKILNRLQREYGKDFKEIFKTITFDNGPEGSDFAGMEKNKRTSIYYAHPYSSFERGTNEQWNGMVRRFIPKGSRFDIIKKEDVLRISNSINLLPRKRFNYRTPLDMWYDELEYIRIA
jgi:IS30 family transposase